MTSEKTMTNERRENKESGEGMGVTVADELEALVAEVVHDVFLLARKAVVKANDNVALILIGICFMRVLL